MIGPFGEVVYHPTSRGKGRGRDHGREDEPEQLYDTNFENARDYMGEMVMRNLERVGMTHYWRI